MRNVLYVLLSLIAFLDSNTVLGQNIMNRANEKLIDIIMIDVFNPPVASRVHVYPNIAAFAVLSQDKGTFKIIKNSLKDFPNIASPKQKVDIDLASLKAFCLVAKTLVYSEFMITDFENKELSIWLNNNKSDSVLMNNSVAYGMEVANKVIEWMKQDNYTYTRTLMRYVLIDSMQCWRPTPPDYANALEPNWPLMRSMVFDSITAIKAFPNIPYSEKKNSLYYKNAMEVYKNSKKLTKDKTHIAMFWDCNPNITVSNGHMSYFVHKVSPGGHWLRIGGKAAIENHFDVYQTSQLYFLMTIGLYEGFLSCWTTKYQYNSVRPETYINRLIDAKWKPLIETPPFPEYTSGHSVISAVSANILTALIPQPYSFVDSSEMQFGIAPRSFTSFIAAAQEASISRFNGGIHYMPALDNGAKQGEKIAAYIINRFK